MTGLMYGTWGSVAYTQYGNLPLLQIISVTGMWGVTFLVAWFGSVINWIWAHRAEWQKIRTVIGLYSGTFILVMVFGGMRLLLLAPKINSFSVASFTPLKEYSEFLAEIKKKGYSSLANIAKGDRETARQIAKIFHDGLFRRIQKEAHKEVEVIFLPETTTVVMQEDETSFIKHSCELANKNGLYLLISYLMIPRDYPNQLAENKSVLINFSGKVVYEYLRSHPVPGANELAGDGLLHTAETPFGRLSSVICYDMDFPNLIRQAGKARVDVMLVPAWDWKAIDPLHTHMAVFRAIENGFSMIRHSGEGLSIAVDYLGQTVAAMDHFTTQNGVMISQVPTKGVNTIYSQIGDLFAWLCVASLAIITLLSLTPIKS